MTATARPEEVLEFWFPDDGHWDDLERHRTFWMMRMQGGMDAAICERFAGIAEAAARGLLDHWAETPRGRLALLIALDQFPRSLWRDTPAAYAQDIKACRLALDGIACGDYDALELWEQNFFIVALSHCEGPDHCERMTLVARLTEVLADAMPQHLEPLKARFVAQGKRVRGLIEQFGRHPHRNPILGRLSSPEEEAYIAAGDFPHVQSRSDAPA